MWGDSGLYYCIITTPDDLEGKHEDSVELLVLGKSRPSAKSAAWTAGDVPLSPAPLSRVPTAFTCCAGNPALRDPLSSCLSGSRFSKAMALYLAVPRVCPLLS